ncbi:alpha/beta hydrolase [Niabella beijingensis]|uniref:alpha/beta hydrolase n=1 Tax=Niabella beijingensis TaxID=2872700 RepID=UPI001CBB9086|nr:alpha/beta hydrolase [Niabella beijingensis]MBZ4191991.1 alpha/beta hydrolase [Niabella beijingensis]
MSKQVLFIQGGGDDGFTADAPLAASLQEALGAAYQVHYPQVQADEIIMEVARQWLHHIDKQIAAASDGLILTGHSLGGSMLLKYLSENTVRITIAGVFLVAPPYWNGDQDWVQPLKLQEGFPAQLPKDIPLFFYQCRDDEVVPFDHFTRYRQQLPRSVFRELPSGGHQFNDDLSIVATDIESL